MYKTKTKELLGKRIDLKLYGRNNFNNNTLDLVLGFDINAHYLAIDLIFIGVTIWWRGD